MSRDSALARFRERGFPTPAHEDWKYTDLSDVVRISERWLAGPATAEAPDHDRIARTMAEVDADWLVLANGALVEEHSALSASAGIDVTVTTDGDPSDSTNVLSDLNVAHATHAVTIRISGDRTSAKPLGLLIADSAETGPQMSQVRIDVVAERNSASSLIEYHVSSGTDEHYSNAWLTLTLGDGARLDYVRMQDRDTTHSQTARLDVHLGRDSTLRHLGVDLGGRLTRNDLDIDLAAPGAEAVFDGLYIAGEGQHIDNHTRVDHRVGPARSRQEYRGILSGACRAVWNGKAVVHAGADGTDAEQANHNLLLSENCEIDAKPELEIYADEVKCAHGTTVGQLDEDALFYLRSRGLDKASARRALIHAFATSVASKAPIETLQEQLASLIDRHLERITKGEIAALELE